MDVLDTLHDVVWLTLFGSELGEMADNLSHLLISFANFSNITAIVTILVCFVTTAVFILRFNNDMFHFPGAMTMPAPNTANQKAMDTYTNPFSIQLVTPATASLRDGFTLSISSVADGSVSVFWGANINKVHEMLQWSSWSLLDKLATGQALQGDGECLHSLPLVRLEKDSSKDVHYQCPDNINENSLGTSPRLCYPCVVIATVDPQGSYEQPTVIANFTFLHLQDSSVQMASQIVGNFLKLDDGRVFNLQSLFLATNVSQSQQTESSETTMQSDGRNRGQLNPEDTAAPQRTVQHRDLATSLDAVSSTQQDETSRECANAYNIDKKDAVLPHGSGDSCDSESDIPGSTDLNVISDEKDKVQLRTSASTSPVSELSPLVNQCEDSHGCRDISSNISSDINHGAVSESDDFQNDDVWLRQRSNSEHASRVNSHCQGVPSHSRSPVATRHPLIDFTEMDAEIDKPECVVCQVNRISHVILPCRHACACSQCFRKVDRCPMCRGVIETYFTLFDDNSSDIDAVEPAEIDQDGFVNWVYNLNDRLNEYFGFT